MAFALALITFLACLAVGLIVAGIYLLVGLAWSLIAVGLLLFGGLFLIRNGMAHG